MMGRFQPFHLGHLDLVKQILDECDEVIIAITSSQFNYLEKDPFTSGERIEMILIMKPIFHGVLWLALLFVLPASAQYPGWLHVAPRCGYSTPATHMLAGLPVMEAPARSNQPQPVSVNAATKIAIVLMATSLLAAWHL